MDDHVCGQMAEDGSARRQSGVDVHVVVARMIRDIRDDRDLRRTSRSAAFVEVGEESEHYRAIYSRGSPVNVCGDRMLGCRVFELPTEYRRTEVDRDLGRALEVGPLTGAQCCGQIQTFALVITGRHISGLSQGQNLNP